ncbi:MAG: DUF4280 domain-containing protein [Planctomycetaceae bacterium]
MPDPFSILMNRFLAWFNNQVAYVPDDVQESMDTATEAAAAAPPATGLLVNTGSMCLCNKGIAPMPLAAGVPTVMASGTPSFNKLNATPLEAVPSFTMCTSTSNPEVAAATSAAMGVLTPMPCVPVIPTMQWSGTSTVVNIAGQPAVTDKSSITCQWGGTIKIITTANLTVKLS